MKTPSQKFSDLKARREAAGLTRTFHWMTEGDRKQFAEDYKKSESYRIIQELKNAKPCKRGWKADGKGNLVWK